MTSEYNPTAAVPFKFVLDIELIPGHDITVTAWHVSDLTDELPPWLTQPGFIGLAWHRLPDAQAVAGIYDQCAAPALAAVKIPHGDTHSAVMLYHCQRLIRHANGWLMVSDAWSRWDEMVSIPAPQKAYVLRIDLIDEPRLAALSERGLLALFASILDEIAVIKQRG